MSELSRTARCQMREKARKLVGDISDKAVDASDYGPEEVLDSGVKTGLRPISRRQYRKGGKVVGASEGKEAVKHAGRRPRKSGGSAMSADEFVNRDVREANEKRDGTKHVGGFKRGGRSAHADGGVPSTRFNIGPTSGSRMTQAAGLGFKNGGNVNFGPKGDSAKGEMKPPRKHGKAEGGEKIKGATPASHDDEPQDRALIKKMVKAKDLTGKARGGSLDGELQGTRPTGGRLARKDGGDAHWIKDAIGKPGALHKELGVPEGKKIPAKKLEKAEHSKSPLERKRANLAETLKGMNREGRARGGHVGYHVVGNKDGYVYGRKKTMAGAERAMEGVHNRGYSNRSEGYHIRPISSEASYNLNQHDLSGRQGRASGGRTKGKTDINIIIGSRPGAPDGMQPPIGAAPTMPPAMPVPVPAGAPPMPPGAGNPPQVPPPQATPPMPRKSGGRAEYPLDAGAGSGVGREQKLGWYGRSQDR